MSDVSIVCPKCGKRINVHYPDVEIKGTVIYIKCFFCKKETCSNFLKFVETQIKNKALIGKYELIRRVVVFSKKIEKEIFNE